MNRATIAAKANRSNYWDNIKGILILLVVFGHVLLEQSADGGTAKTVLLCIYMFHMPAFVFVSGYFGKSERSRSFESILKLGFLYFVFNTLMGFWKGFGTPMFLTPLYSYWYLIAIIFWRLTAHRLAKVKEIRVILFAVSIFAGFYPAINNVLAMSRIIGFFPFYMAGFRMTAESIERLQQKGKIRRLMIASAAIVAAGVGALIALRFLEVNRSTCQMFAYGERIESFGRIDIYFISAAVILALCALSVNKKIPLLSMFGRNSLWIFLLHRPATILLSNKFCRGTTVQVVFGAVGLTLLLALLFGNDILVRPLNRLAEQGGQLFSENATRKTLAARIVVLGLGLALVLKVIIGAYAGVSWKDMKALLKGEQAPTTGDFESGDEPMFAAMSNEQKNAFDQAFRITFAGDLILLEDQVKRGKTKEGYDFSEVFEYAKPYIESADFAIGVFEGPMAGAAAGYSSSNFNDGKELWLNFPDEFAIAVKEAGFDLVTTANNHLLDRGVDGTIRTLDVMDQIGLNHTGTYRNAREKETERVKLVTIEGIRIAVLSYTYGSNKENKRLLDDDDLAFLSSVACGTSGELFEKCKKQVIQDLDDAKEMNPDLIVVLPHWGGQFDNVLNGEQMTWQKIFAENGADIILGDHAHVVQPIRIENFNGKDVFCAFCPGNFANIYRDKQGDTSMLVDVYIDRETKKVIGGSIVPLYTQATLEGNYRALPVYEIMNNSQLRKQLSTDDLLRVEKANETVTRVVLDETMSISMITERYYFDANGFCRSKTTGMAWKEGYKKGAFYRAVKDAQSICFVGDSITEGTRNGGCPWYEPLEEYLTGKTVLNYSKGGCTVSYMIEKLSLIPIADVYVIALGTNDVRYRDSKLCAMTKEDYVIALDRLRKGLVERSPSATFVFIAPWYSIDGDPYCELSFAEKTRLNEAYSEELERYCVGEGDVFVNPNSLICEALENAPSGEYLLDHIHPNALRGVVLYSEAVVAWGLEK